ncbi:formate dehydrogenase subunit delta [Microvirga sp. VF16]|uniref:formate dehydrogenase subunit delta n=1 Tax=Microvirga sp. VF16 TaxID=2807101 RepID=UPI00193D6E02|nr:formate dehydrogenase subunit delta [Microvirga sp. VF16]QRM35717.1 formate dehydrogenase subunit delta [Microvirga sp. VF16]
MSTEKLIRMANQIAAFFRSYPEEEAVAGIRNHLMAFWTPRMRGAIATYAGQEGDKLDPLVLKAVQPFRMQEGIVTGTADGSG